VKVSSMLMEELGLIHWKKKTTEECIQDRTPVLDEPDLQLLKNILKSIQIHYDKSSLSETQGFLCYHLRDTTLVFDDVEQVDTKESMHLAPLKSMNADPMLKKKTWFKLKKRFL
jgi:hypothetical protein